MNNSAKNINLNDYKLYYIPTYVERKYRSTLSIAKKYLDTEYNIKETSNMRHCCFILSVYPLSLTSKTTYTISDIFELIESPSREVEWSDVELKNLQQMISSKDINTRNVGLSILYNINPTIIKEAVKRKYIQHHDIFQPYNPFEVINMGDKSVFNELAIYYLRTLFIQGNK